MTVSDPDLRSWIDYVFDHPVSDPAWHWAPEAARLTLTPTREAELYAETFERSEEMLQRFSSAQVDQGLDYLTSNMCSSHMFACFCSCGHQSESSSLIGRHIANQHSPQASQHWIPIDACHDFPHVVTEFLAYKDTLVPGGLMLFHDVTTNHDFARGTPTWEFWQGYGSRACRRSRSAGASSSRSTSPPM